MTINSHSTDIGTNAQRSKQWFFAACVILFVFAAYLRFVNLAWNPGWYSDEGSDINIAWNMMEGRFQYFAVNGTPLVAARMPLFHLILIAAFKGLGFGILTARLVVALSGFAAMVVLFAAVREMLGRRQAWLTAFIFTIMPNALQYDRLAFSYDLQALFVTLCWWMIWKFDASRQVRWLFVASLAAASAYMTALTGLPLILCVALVALLRAPRHLPWSIGLMLAPGVIYLGVLYALAPQALAQDLALTVNRSSVWFGGQLFNLLAAYTAWFDWTPWIVLGVAGLFVIKPRAVRVTALLVFFTILFNVMRLFPGSSLLSFHRYLEILPLLALGAAQFFALARDWLSTLFDSDLGSLRLPRLSGDAIAGSLRRFLRNALVFIFLIVPLVWSAVWQYYLVSSPELPTKSSLDPFSAAHPLDAIAVTDFVNGAARANDLVLASPTIAWRLQSRVADFQQALAFHGVQTENYGSGLERDRFAFDVSFERADFVILDNLWRKWATDQMPPLVDYTRVIETWPRVMHLGEYDVYRNPSR